MAETRLRITEADFQRQVIDLAELLGWMVIHHRPARTKDGWRTAVEGTHAAGYPDLTLVRDRLIVAEIKSEKGRVTDDQHRWLGALREAGIAAYVWRPSDWGEVERTLRGGRPDGFIEWVPS